MDNLTHSLIGLTAAKAGLEKLSPGATVLCVLAANAPDADIITGLLGDRWIYLRHHRGITHSIVGALAIAITLPLIFYFVDLLIARVRKRPSSVKLIGLTIASLVATATHPFMDWTNNYGVRPFLPWSSEWFYGDFLFVIDPVLWLTLGGAAFLLTGHNKKKLAVWLLLAAVLTFLVFFGPTDRGGLANPMLLRVFWIIALVVLLILFWRDAGKRWKHRVAIAAFVIVSIYMSGLSLLHRSALKQARREAAMISVDNSERVVDVAAMPVLANPFNWLCVVETERAAYKFSLSLADSRGRRNEVRYERPEVLNSPAMAQANSDRRTTFFMEFARFPIARIVGEDCTTRTLVQFADLRYTEPGENRGTFSLEVPVECPVPLVRNE
ncbi:MAG TPA: metal-dependent hydrolase [Pyrinomonadaceae bacterium]|nr:metal-dependent hydrolase [Pyrinomonadaceae bacterium]